MEITESPKYLGKCLMLSHAKSRSREVLSQNFLRDFASSREEFRMSFIALRKEKQHRSRKQTLILT